MTEAPDIGRSRTLGTDVSYRFSPRPERARRQLQGSGKVVMSLSCCYGHRLTSDPRVGIKRRPMTLGMSRYVLHSSGAAWKNLEEPGGNLEEPRGNLEGTWSSVTARHSLWNCLQNQRASDVQDWKQDGGKDEAPEDSGIFVPVDYSSGSDEDPTRDLSVRSHSPAGYHVSIISHKCPIRVQQWASVLSVQLREFTTKYSGSLLLQKKLKDVESIIKIVELDAGDLVKDYSDEIERMLGSKMKSVKRLAESAEDADLYHEFNASLEFDYYNSMMINTMDEDGNPVELGGEFPLEENEHFNNLLVNTQQSNIQVPTNVYNKDPNILNAIYNSEALNDVFISNFQKDPTLTWQYFGSSTGFFRIYPGIKWTPDSNGVAAFDCRNRNWYIQAATSPKDIIIMVDISGSMKGLKMTIAKHTINTILDTLGENDFVNVIAHFKLLVEELHVKGEAKIKNAMKESFKILNEGSMCNQAIMLITDGAMEDFESVFEEFNWPDRRENVMEYLHVLSRPMVINHDHDIIWTEAYMDTVLFTTKAQSLLLMTSVAMPVFSKKRETLSHGILLGVVGSDIPLMEVMKLAPRYMLRTAMVKGETGSISLSIRASVDKGKRPLYLINDYFYTNIDETPFSFGMVLTRGHGKLMFVGNVSVEEGLHDLTSPDLFIASEWTYCETDIDPAHRKYSQLQAAIRYLLGKEPDLECDEVLLQQTLFDAVVTAPLEAYWNALILNDRKFLTPADKDNLFTVDHFPLWYRLAVENTPGSFYYYPVNDKGVKYVLATTAVTVSSEGKTAIAGGEFQHCPLVAR
ncbi:hypothetical protein PAMA_019908 [Pampus argenteus]